MRGFQSDELTEYAHSVELAAAVATWHDAQEMALIEARKALDAGCRAHVVADALGISRSTLYRWLSTSSIPK